MIFNQLKVVIAMVLLVCNRAEVDYKFLLFSTEDENKLKNGFKEIGQDQQAVEIFKKFETVKNRLPELNTKDADKLTVSLVKRAEKTVTDFQSEYSTKSVSNTQKSGDHFDEKTCIRFENFVNNIDPIMEDLANLSELKKQLTVAKNPSAISGTTVVSLKPGITTLADALTKQEADSKNSGRVKNGDGDTTDSDSEIKKLKDAIVKKDSEKRNLFLFLGLGLGVGLPVLFAIVIAVLIKTDRLTWNKSKSNFVHQV